MVFYTKTGSDVSIIMHDTLGVSDITMFCSKLDVILCFITSQTFVRCFKIWKFCSCGIWLFITGQYTPVISKECSAYICKNL